MTAQPYQARHATTAHRASAWAVHAYTASGALAAFAAVLAIFDDRFQTAFALMVAATVIDGTDGVLARLARVKEVIPHFDGARLDDIVDYMTFVFVPMLLLYEAGDLPRAWAAIPVAAVLLSSAYGFCRTDAKTDDGFFTGFPSYWNIVAIYLHAGRLAPALSAGTLLLLSVLVFVRNGYVYPTRTPILRGLTIALGALWGLMVLGMIATMPDVPGTLVVASLFFPLYYAVLSFILDARRGPRP
jgi:phosphatidylcholine synthase